MVWIDVRRDWNGANCLVGGQGIVIDEWHRSWNVRHLKRFMDALWHQKKGPTTWAEKNQGRANGSGRDRAATQGTAFIWRQDPMISCNRLLRTPRPIDCDRSYYKRRAFHLSQQPACVKCNEIDLMNTATADWTDKLSFQGARFVPMLILVHIICDLAHSLSCGPRFGADPSATICWSDGFRSRWRLTCLGRPNSAVQRLMSNKTLRPGYGATTYIHLAEIMHNNS